MTACAEKGDTQAPGAQDDRSPMTPSSASGCSPKMPVSLRAARSTDIDRLVEIENAAFQHDRISRRSFRKLIDRRTAETIVAEDEGRIVGYCMVLFRTGTAVARLYSIAVAPDHSGKSVGRALLAGAEEAAHGAGRMLLRLELREENTRALNLYHQAGYHQIGKETDYYEDGAAALRMEKLLRGADPFVSPVPHYTQSVDFTCGPCCLMMARAHFDPSFTPDPVMEIRLWREATTVFMMSGPGGCEPFGLAVAAYDHGLSSSIIVSSGGPLFLQSVRDVEKRRVMELAQIDFRTRCEAAGIDVAYRPFTLHDVRSALAAGQLVAVLVSGFVMFEKKVPHWVLAIGDDGGHIIVHDPWVEDEAEETSADAASIPIPYPLFMRMARFGSDNLRAAVTLGAKKEKE
jgi:ribosomal protein S18 acetylase RimI-like enzyme